MLSIRIENKEYLKEDGTFNLDKAVSFSGKIAGICYDEEGYDHVLTEADEKTQNRINMTLNNGHHSVYDHVFINFYIKGLSKILAIILNNEKQYTTSERSLRYTAIKNDKDSIISEEEVYLYNKWLGIFKNKNNEKYPNVFNNRKIKTLAQENARALVTVFMPTEMIYTTSLRQINYIASFMFDYIENVENNYMEAWMYKFWHKDKKGYFESTLVSEMKEFLYQLKELNLLVPELLGNEKHRKLSLFGNNLDKRVEYFGDVYLTKYQATFAQVAQAQRHRTVDYQIEIPDSATFAIPEIIADDEALTQEWIKDISSVKDIIPIGQLLNVVERGKYEDFILKCKERLCSAAQLEIMKQTRETLLKYKKALEEQCHPLAEDIEKYSHGARCTFPDFTCPKKCNFAEGIQLVRKI